MRDVHRRSAATGLLSALIAFSIGCSSRPSDEVIAKNIQQKITADPETKDLPVTVTAKAGKVTLSGTVKTQTARQKLEQIASNEPGATGLDDLTAVQPEPPPAPEPINTAQTKAPVEGTAPTPAPAPVEKPKPQPIVVPAGTVLTVRTSDALSSKTSQTGQTFLAALAQPVSVGGKPALPVRATVSGRVVSAKAAGKVKGEGELTLELTSITVGSRTYPIETNPLSNRVKGKGKRTAKTTGAGAAGGALIGGLAGGGKGAGIGALVGAGAGFVGGAATGNRQVEIPSESALSFILAAPLTLPPAKSVRTD